MQCPTPHNPSGVRPPPHPLAPLYPTRAQDTQARDLAGQAPTPAPVYPRRGARPPYARNGGAGQEVTRPPRLCTTGTRHPPLPPFTREQGTPMRDKPPPLQPPLPFAREGGWGTGTRTHDAGRRNKARASPPSPGTPRASNARGGAAAPPVCARSQLECAPGFTRTQRANRDAQKRRPLHDTWASEPGGALEPNANGRTHGSAPPPLSPVRAPGPNANGRPRGTPPLPWVHAPGPNVSGRPCGSSPLPRVRVPGANASGRPRGNPPPFSRGFARKGETQPHGGSAPLLRVCAPGGARVGWCMTGRRANGRRIVTWWRPPSALRTGAARMHVLPLCAKRKSTASPVHEWEDEDNERGHAE
ncbi:hypothetical protein EDB89DRAFT_2241615 [Lactarius sanguifluus]|nr:hypothetical protein EDB89DRAFT_2241615 [Lactarius sanguifluus]